MRRHWITVLAPVVLLLACALVLGVKRTPQYTATATVAVGPVFVNSPAGIASALQGTQSLASVYSRLINANAVLEGTARKLGDRSLPHPATLLATPIAESPLVKVTATASSDQRAIALVNAASAALADFVNRSGTADDEAEAISKRYRTVALRFRQQAGVRDQLMKRYRDHRTEANRLAADRAAAAADTARLRRDGLLPSYEAAVEGVSASPSLKVLASATAASTDRYGILQILVFVGLIVGLAVGLALALVRDQAERQPGPPC